VDGVEGERRLARSRQPGDDHELVAGELEVDRLQIVLAGTADDDAIVGHGRSIILPRPGAVKPTPPPRDAPSTGTARVPARRRPPARGSRPPRTPHRPRGPPAGSA